MSHKLNSEMQNRFIKDFNHINAQQDAEDSDNSQQSEDYYEYERKKMQAALLLLKTRQNNSILDQLKKNTNNENDYLDQFQDQVVDLHKITRNNQKNVLQQSVIKEIKQKVFNQSMLNTIHLADQQLEKRKSKQQVIQKQQKVNSAFKKQENQIQNKLNKKIELAKIERQILQMSRQDELSMKYEQQVLSDFFSQRFFTPDIKIPKNKMIPVNIENYLPKTTFTNLKPLPNTQNNVLPKNAPQLALRRLGRSKKIVFKHSSMSQVAVKYKKLNPQQLQVEKINEQSMSSNQNDGLTLNIQNYLQFLTPLLPQINSISQKYRPKYLPQFRSQNQQNFNIDNQVSTSKQKSLQDCLSPDNPQMIKDIKLTFQHLNNLKGIQNFKNVQHAALQFNLITQLNQINLCSKLIQIDLSNNKLKTIQTLKDLKWLRLLNVQKNRIQMLELRGGSLQVLYASHNRIQQIIDLSENAYLKKLKINNNNLHQLNGLSRLFYLQQLQASNNYLTSTSGLDKCILLRSLNLSHNRLQSLHTNFTYIFLHKLYLSHNSLHQFPNLLLPSLQQLYLDHNKIQNQENKNIYLPSLKLLNIDENKLLGFGAVWIFLRYSQNLKTLKYDRNQYFMNLRDKVRQLYQHIIYKNMNKLQILNQSPFDIGIKKYYESVYKNYLTSDSIFKYQNYYLLEIHKKIMFTIKQNQFISQLEDKKTKFTETDIFINYKSIKIVEDFLEIIHFLSICKKQQSNKDNMFNDKIENKEKIMHASKSIFYQHDKFQYKMRDSLHKIKNMIIAKQYRILKRRKYFIKQKPNLSKLFSYLQKYILTKKIKRVIGVLHWPLQRMSEEKAAIIIQKNWRCYRLRKKYKKIIKKLRQNKQDSDLEDIDLDDYNFDEMQIPQFNFQLPEDMDFDQFIIKPEIFQMLNNQQQKREQIINNSNMQQNRNHNYNQNNNQGGQRAQGQMMNNFVQNNTSNVSEQFNSAQQKRQNQIQKIMKQWGVNRQAAIALVAKNNLKQQRKKKQAEKNMSAAQRYQKFRKYR